MKKNRMLALMTCLSLLISGCGAAVSEEVQPIETTVSVEDNKRPAFDPEKAKAAGKKDETVMVYADPYGKPKKNEVTSTLQELPDSEFILDASDLSDIRNTEGDEEWEAYGDGNLLWENAGKEIVYKGISNKELPVGIKVTYMLDGKQVSADEICGKSGDVKIRFDYINEKRMKVRLDQNVIELPEKKKENEEDSDEYEEDDEDYKAETFDSAEDYKKKRTIEKEVPVPYMFMTLAVLPEDHFSNIEVENGSLNSFSGTQAVIGYAIPGIGEILNLDSLKDSEDDSKDGSGKDAGKELENGNGDEEEEDFEFPEYVEISAHAEDFEINFTATVVTCGLLSDLEDEDLADMDEMSAGIGVLSELMERIIDGSGKLEDGAKKFGDGLTEYTDAIDQLNDGVWQLQEGVDTLDSNGAQLTSGALALSEGLSKIDDALSDLDLSDLSEGIDTTDLEAAATAAAADGQTLSTGLTSLGSAFEKLEPSISGLIGTVSSATEDLSGSLEELASAEENLSAAESALAEARTSLTDAKASCVLTEEASEEDQLAMEAVLTALEAADFGVESGETAVDAANKAVASAEESVGSALGSFQEITEPDLSGLDIVSVSEAALDLTEQMGILQSSFEELSSISMPEDLSKQVKNLKTGISKLASGAEDLCEGVELYTSGVSQLNEGMGAVAEGTDQLSSLGGELTDGYGKLTDGIGKLKEGLQDFNEEALSELSDRGGKKLQDVITSLRALTAADREEKDFTGSAPDTETEVRYIIETEEISSE